MVQGVSKNNRGGWRRSEVRRGGEGRGGEGRRRRGEGRGRSEASGVHIVLLL